MKSHLLTLLATWLLIILLAILKQRFLEFYNLDKNNLSNTCIFNEWREWMNWIAFVYKIMDQLKFCLQLEKLRLQRTLPTNEEPLESQHSAMNLSIQNGKFWFQAKYKTFLLLRFSYERHSSLRSRKNWLPILLRSQKLDRAALLPRSAI